jgi:outer membrane biosynthesis protein TonB
MSPKKLDAKSNRLYTSGIPGKGGKTKRGQIGLSVNRRSVRLSFDQLHDVRSKIRFMHTANEHDVQTIGGKRVARGESLEITDSDGNSITIPVNDKTLEELDHAVKGAIGRGEGSVSWLAENAGQVQELAKEFGNQEDPFDWLERAEVEINGKKQPISLGGRYAILHYYVFDKGSSAPLAHLGGKMTRESMLRRMRGNIASSAEKYGGKEGAKAAYNEMLAQYDKHKDEAEKRLTERSGTQAMVESLMEAAALKFRIIGGSQPRSGRGKKAPKADKPRTEKPRAEKPRREAPPVEEAPKPRAEKPPKAEKPRAEEPPKAKKPKEEKKPKAEKPKADTSKLHDRIQASSAKLSRNMTPEQISSAINDAEKLLSELKRGKHIRGEMLDIAEMRLNAASVGLETDPGRAQSSLKQVYDVMASSVGSARKSLDVRSLVQAAFAEVLGI